MSQRLTLAIALLVLMALAIQVAFLAGPAQRGFPLDDGWIHATYARNLATHGQLCLNPGQPSTGTTSFLWTALLATTHLAIGHPVVAALVWNIPLHVWLVLCTFLLVRDSGLTDRWALRAAAACALIGNLAWIGLAGMEATLFVALGLTAIWLRSCRRPLAAGMAMGLLVLTRPEGLALPIAIAAAELLAARRGQRPDWRHWLRLFAPAAAGAAIYFAINLALTGQLLTSTYAGRRWLAGEPAALDLSPLALGGRTLAFADSWARYLCRWLFGMVLLMVFGVGAAQAISGIVGGTMALVALVGLIGLWRTRRTGSPAGSPLLMLVGWTALHNLTYIVLLPSHGHAGRYQAVNFVVIAVLVIAGIARIAEAHGRLRHLAPVALALWATLCIGSATLWRVVYRNSVDHINTVHVACGRWIASNLPPEAVVATYDLGAISFFANRPIADLGGLVDPAMARALFAGNCVPELRRQGATHLAMVRRDKADDHLARRLGLLPHAPGRPRLISVRSWSIPYTRHRLHHLATSNAAPRITLYRLQWPKPL